MRKTLVALLLGLTALAAAACGTTGTTSAPVDSLTPIESPSDSVSSEAPAESVEASPEAS